MVMMGKDRAEHIQLLFLQWLGLIGALFFFFSEKIGKRR